MRRLLDFYRGAALAMTLAPVSLALAADGGRALPSADFDWVRVETANFTVYGNAGEEAARKHAVSLEQLWAVLAKHFDEVPAVATVPTRVYVFDLVTDAYLPYGPVSKKGKPIPSGGYFTRGRHADYAAVVENDYRYPDRMALYHDIVHNALDRYLPALPVWLEEGLCEYYSVFFVEEGRARVGFRVNRHIAWLRNRSMMPLPELFAVDAESPQIDEDDRTGVFYAQSWLLVHLMLTERPDGRERLLRYAELLRGGRSRDDAFAQAFETGYRALEKELKKYVRSRSYHYSVFPLSSDIVKSATASRMEHKEVLVRLGDLLADGLEDRWELAAEHYRTALEIDKGFAPALAGLGMIDTVASRYDSAIDRLQRAAELAPNDPSINLLLGLALVGRADADGAGNAAADLDRARRALRRAAELRPELVEPWATLGATYVSDPVGSDPGIAALERAFALEPKRVDVGCDLTALYVLRGEVEQAKSVIARMAAAGAGEQELKRAREIVAQDGG